MSLEETIEDLQTRISFQEDTISKLSDIVARHDKQLQEVQNRLSLTINKVSDLSASNNEGGEDAPPPHY